VIPALLLAATLAAAPAPRLGAEVVIAEPTRGPVVAVLGSVRVDAEIVGDVVALGGDVTLGDGGRVVGDVVAVGGAIDGGARVAGRAIAVATLDGSASDGVRPHRTTWGLRALRVGGWVVVASILLVALPRQVRRGGESLRLMPVRTLAVGVLSVGVWLVAVLLALALSASRLGIVLLLAGIAAFLVAKVLGLLAVAWLAGWGARGLLPPAWRNEISRTGAGMFALAVAGVVPLVGPLVWLAANVAGVGAVVVALVAPRLTPLALSLQRGASA